MNVVARIPLPPRVYRRVLKTKRRWDPYREGSLRYMGYANEVGEALEKYLPDWGLPASYCVAASYVLFDTLDKGQRAYETTPKEERFEETFRVSLETFTWQMLASVFWPGGVIRLTVNTINFLMPNDNEYLSTVLGILLIPIIVRPIDETVDKVVENCLSKLLRGKVRTTEDVEMLFWSATSSFSVPPVLFAIASVLKKLKT
jgi:fission process protein 1